MKFVTEIFKQVTGLKNKNINAHMISHKQIQKEQ